MESGELDTTNVTPLGVIILVCMALLTIKLQRKYAIVPLMLTTCYMPLGQVFVIAGAHVQFFRLLLLIGWIRVFVRREATGISLGRMDKVFIWWAIVTLVLGSLTQPAVFSERLFNRCGVVYNAIGTYFLIRCWLRNLDELIGMVRVMSLMIAPLAIAMLFEKATGHNVFSVFGGVPELTSMRDGKLRCQGAFRHPILAGTYGATIFPVFVGLWFQGREYRKTAAIGVFSSIFICYSASSSGALLALLGAVIALILWRYRFRMAIIRRGILFTFIALALVMKAPVWYIITRISDVIGGSGWYRSFIIDQAINHFDEWWLVGSRYTAHWAPAGEVVTGNAGNTDIINNYIYEGLDGGIVKLILFIALIVTGFKIVGGFSYMRPPMPFRRNFFIWTLGACLLSHSLSFLSVAYFDQIVVVWYWILAVIAVIAFESPNPLGARPRPDARGQWLRPMPH